MTDPRQVLPGTTYEFYRRCAERKRLLHPDRGYHPGSGSRRPDGRPIWLYSLGLAMQRHGVQVHALCVLGNKHLLVLSDPQGRLSDFAREFHANVARGYNRLRRRGESLWGPGSFSAPPLPEDAEAVLGAMVAVIVAPVAAGLVERPEQWPGLCTRPDDVGRAYVQARPSFFFRDPIRQAARWGHHPSRLPEEVRVPITPPPQLAHLSAAELRRLLRERVDAALEGIHAARRAKGLGYLGRRAILAEDPFTPPPGDRTPRELRRYRWKEAERRRANREFLRRHREARLAFQAGDREAIFPAGTWRAVRVYGARVERPPDASAA